jgi:hypothetical protein
LNIRTFQKLAMPLVLTGVAAFAPSLASADSIGTVRAMFCDNGGCNSSVSDSMSAGDFRSGSDDADVQVHQGLGSAVQTLLEKHDIPLDRLSAVDSKPIQLDSYTRYTFHFARVPDHDGTGEPPTGPGTPVPAPESSSLSMLLLGLAAVITGFGQRKRFIQS